jgi:hypothetical protein
MNEEVKEEKVKLNGSEITQQQLEEEKKNGAVRIIETAPGEYRKLEHLREAV